MNDNTILAQKRKKEKKKNKKLSTYREKLVLCTYRMLITIKNFDETVFGLKKNTKCQINEKKEKFIPRRCSSVNLLASLSRLWYSILVRIIEIKEGQCYGMVSKM